YCFQVYHHQRWWFPTGWSNFLLPEDPPVWSDQHGKPIPKLHDFTLPPDTYIGPPNEMNQQRCVSWVWMDPFWSKQKDVVGDKQSWQYGSKWKNWSSDANGSGFYTRRRKWFRYAQRKE
ncbi:uncharacterized protein EV154DRAFT_398489, partial [Mucor mucedo]|uniref:uncharacterized protein n=1 Tax=Mucor mucedo TaxID=29922 RepID=UPI002220AFFC